MPVDIIKVKTKNDLGLKKFKDYGKVVEFGIPKMNNSRKADSDEVRAITNAEIMAIMEAGSVVNNIPQRKVFSKVVELYKDRISDYFEKIFKALANNDESTADKLMEQLALSLQSWSQHFLDTDNGLKPNAPITVHGGWMHRNGKSFYVQGKGFNHPLVHTGELKKSIRGLVVKEK